MSLGFLETLEMRVPVTPNKVILMTWSDLPDAQQARVTGLPRHAKSLNAFTIAEADTQWFHSPRGVPPVGAGSFLPLSTQVLPNYNAPAAANSLRRAEVHARIQPKIGKPVEEEFEIVTLTAPSGT
jgi:hypothetical protein